MKDTTASQELKAFLEDGLSEEIRRVSLAFVILILIGFWASYLSPELLEIAMERIHELFAAKNLVSPQGTISFLGLFTNNAWACVFIMLYGLIPFAYLPALALGTNAIMMGVMAADSLKRGVMLPFLVGILPHGIFEIPAMLLSFAMGLYVCGQMTRRCKKDKSAHSFSENLLRISRFFFLILVPVLLLAAVIEAWVTPVLLQLFV